MFWRVEYLRKQYWMFWQIKSKTGNWVLQKAFSPDTLGDGTLFRVNIRPNNNQLTPTMLICQKLYREQRIKLWRKSKLRI